MKLRLSGMDFTDLLLYEEALKQLSPQRQLDDLDSYLIATEAFLLQGKILLIIREINSFAMVEIPFAKDELEDNDDSDIGLIINSTRLYHTLHSYPFDQLKDLVIEIETGDNSAFRIFMKNDKLSLSHLVLSSDHVKEHLELAATILEGEPSFDLSLFNDGKDDFMKGLIEGMSLIEDNEKKNNAFALYDDRLVTNYNRHVFIYRYDHPVVFLKHEEAVSLHKRIAKMFITLASKKRVFDAKMSPDGSRVIITSASFKAVMNNAISNINPPTQDSLDKFRSINMIGEFEVSSLANSTQFIYGYYSSGREFNALIISYEKEGIRFTLKDSGVAGYNTCQVDRLIEKGIKPSSACSSTVVIESLLGFIKPMKKEDTVQIYMDDNEEHIAVFLKNSKREIYLAKLS